MLFFGRILNALISSKKVPAMIVHPPVHWFRLILAWRGSILPAIFPRLMLVLAVALGIVIFHRFTQGFGLQLSVGAFSLIGLALAIFLGFRNSSSYERYWEARKLWGSLLINARSLQRQAMSMTTLPADHHQLYVFSQLIQSFAYALNHQLRCTDPRADLYRLLPYPLAKELSTARYIPSMILVQLAQYLSIWHRTGKIDVILFQSMDANLNHLSDIQGGCERIMSTPIPYAYSVLIHRTIYSYCILLPLGLVDSCGILTPLITVFIAYTFMALENIASSLELPFGFEPNDLALNAICRTIERSLLEMRGDNNLPPALLPQKNYILD